MANSSRDMLFGRLADFRIDVDRLKEHYLSVVSQQPSTPYHDNQVNYVGWSVTSRDGSLSDGVKRIAPKPGGVRGKTETEICTGYLKETLDLLRQKSLNPYRVRIMKLENEGTEMGWHTDAETETWRLHIPIITNANAFFEWKLADRKIESVHLPADGSAWLVRVDITHRAVNRNAVPSERVHLLMGLPQPPSTELIGSPSITL